MGTDGSKINKKLPGLKEDDLCVGDKVEDAFGNRGIVVKIIKGNDDIDHGTVYVWQLDRVEYGQDNCEHYPELGWERILKKIRR